MLVAAESAVAAVWDASRAAAEDSSEDEAQFRLAAAVAALPPALAASHRDPVHVLRTP